VSFSPLKIQPLPEEDKGTEKQGWKKEEDEV
jgi:hypothetical protein